MAATKSKSTKARKAPMAKKKATTKARAGNAGGRGYSGG